MCKICFVAGSIKICVTINEFVDYSRELLMSFNQILDKTQFQLCTCFTSKLPGAFWNQIDRIIHSFEAIKKNPLINRFLLT